MGPLRAIIALVGLLLLTTNTCNSAPAKCTCEDLVISPSDQSCLLGHLLQIITHLINNQQKPICPKGLIQNPNKTFVSSPASGTTLAQQQSATTEPPSNMTTSESEFDVRDLELTTLAPSVSPSSVLDSDLPATTLPPLPPTESQSGITTVPPASSQSEDMRDLEVPSPSDITTLTTTESPATDVPQAETESYLPSTDSTPLSPSEAGLTEQTPVEPNGPSSPVEGSETASPQSQTGSQISNLPTLTTALPEDITTPPPPASLSEDSPFEVRDLEIESQTTQTPSPPSDITTLPPTTELPSNVTTPAPSGPTSTGSPFEIRDLELPQTNQDSPTDSSSVIEVEQPVKPLPPVRDLVKEETPSEDGSGSSSESESYESGEDSEPGSKSIEEKAARSAPNTNSTTPLAKDQKCMKPQTLFIPVLNFGNCLTPEKLQEYLYNIYLNPEHYADIKS